MVWDSFDPPDEGPEREPAAVEVLHDGRVRLGRRFGLEVVEARPDGVLLERSSPT